MHSIKQVTRWPGIVSQALWTTPKKEDSLLKKTAIYAYDILAAAAVLATVVVGVAIYILGNLFNTLLIQPLRILSLWYSLQGAVPKTFQQLPPGCEMPSDNYFVNAAEFPAVLHRQAAPDVLPPAPKIAFSWPSKNNQGANSLFLDFLHAKTTIPETSYSIWDLFSTAGSKKGANYWNKHAHILVPLLFPSKSPSTLNSSAPVLTANAFSALHKEDTPDLRGKYMFTLLMCLQFWGISLDKNLNFQISPQFDTQSIRNNPHREALLQQIITSLVECGFAHPAVHLADFINKNKHLYNLSEDIFQKLFQTLREQETHILDTAIKASSKDDSFEPTDYMSTMYWKTYMDTCASTGPYEKDGFICNATSLNAIQTQEEVAQGKTLKGWDLDILHHFLPDSPPAAGDRPILGLYAPPYFCSLAEEKGKTIPSQTSKKTFTSYIAACSKWFFTQVSAFGCNSAPFPINMDSPDASSVLRKMPLTPKITSKTLPFVFSRASGPLGIEVTKTKKWPPLKLGRTNDFGEKFFEGTVTIPKSDTNFWNLVRQGGTALGFSHLESTHNLVQVAAPIPFTSKYEPHAPQLSRELVYRIQTDPTMASKYLLSIFTYLRFFGIELDGSGAWQRTADFGARTANARTRTNQLRMSRILQSLTACGFSEFAEELYQFIKIHYREFGFSRKSHQRPNSRSFAGGRLVQIHGFMNNLAYMLPKTGWYSPVGGNYLDGFPSSGTITQFSKSPRWMSKAQVFQGADALITQDPDTGRWELPHLEAPPFFCTREEQENFEASSPVTETPAK